MDLSAIAIPEPTNAERDADPKLYLPRDLDPRWNQYADVRVVVQSRYDIESDDLIWSFFVSKDNGDFITGSDYVSQNAARKECERRIKRGIFKKPATKYRVVKRAEVFGPIGEPSEKLASLLAEWDEEYSA